MPHPCAGRSTPTPCAHVHQWRRAAMWRADYHVECKAGPADRLPSPASHLTLAPGPARATAALPLLLPSTLLPPPCPLPLPCHVCVCVCACVCVCVCHCVSLCRCAPQAITRGARATCWLCAAWAWGATRRQRMHCCGWARRRWAQGGRMVHSGRAGKGRCRGQGRGRPRLVGRCAGFVGVGKVAQLPVKGVPGWISRMTAGPLPSCPPACCTRTRYATRQAPAPPPAPCSLPLSSRSRTAPLVCT